MWKVTSFFSQGKQGWSETFYRDAGPLAQVMTAAKNVMRVRAKMLTSVQDLEAMRYVSSIASDTDFLDTEFNPAPGFPGEKSDFAWTCLTGQMVIEGGKHRILTVRGIPDIPPSDTTGERPGTELRKRFKNFLDALIENNFGLRDPLPATQIPYRIDHIVTDAAAGQVSLFTVAAPIQVQIGKWVVLRGMKGVCGFPRRARVLAILPPASGFTETVISASCFKGAYKLNSGVMLAEAPTFAPFTAGNFLRVSRRDTGRPFGLQAGRSSKRGCAACQC